MARENDLVLRDTATAALIGSLPGQASANFGNDFGDEFGGDEFGGDEFGGDDFGADALEFGAEAIKSVPQAQALVKKAASAVRSANAAKKKVESRAGLLNPNRGSTLKVERYLMSLSNTGTAPTWGAASTQNFGDTPKVTFRPKRLISNVAWPGLFIVSNITVTNIEANVGNGGIDASWFGSNAFDTALDLPAINPSQRLTVVGAWGTYVPPSYVPAASFPLALGAIGPAKMAGN